MRGKANVDLELLATHSDGVIALTGCLQSRFCQRLIADNPAEARAHADELIQVFGADNVYFEVQKNGIADQDKANEGIVADRPRGRPPARRAPPTSTTSGREDYGNHAALLCVQTKSTLAEPKMTFDTNEFFLKDNGEMDGRFAEWPEALAYDDRDRRALRGRDRARQAAHPELPDARRRLGGRRTCASSPRRACACATATRRPPEAVERLEMELEVIGRMGFDSYFLIVWDFVRYAKENGIAVGPGPRLGGGLDRLLRALDHRRRPARLQPPVRALPQPRARVDAGHRHRLLGQRPRRGDPLRRRQVRPGLRRPDRHLRRDEAARRHPRRRTRARAPDYGRATASPS